MRLSNTFAADCTVTLTVTDTAHGFVGVDRALAEIRKAASLLDHRRREAVRVRLVVDELGGDKVIDLDRTHVSPPKTYTVQGTHIVLFNQPTNCATMSDHRDIGTAHNFSPCFPY